MPAAVPRISRVCTVCTLTFPLREKVLLQKPRAGLYCSVACRIAGTKKQMPVTCAQCGGLFGRTVGEIGSTGRAWCTATCQAEYWTANRKSYRRVGDRHIHRVVAEQWLDRPLVPTEIVHHIDENKSNGHATNLCVFPDGKTHMRCHYGRMSAEEFDSCRLVNLLPPVTEAVRAGLVQWRSQHA